MRILHTSDWHLGRILHGIHLTEDQEYVLQQFVQIVKDKKPDVILIAGDIYDRSIPPVEAVELFDKIFSEIIIDLKIPIICIAGNHDSPNRIHFGSRLLKDRGLYIAGKIDSYLEPVILEDEFGPVCFYSLPYTDPALVKEKTGDISIHNHNDAMKVLTDNIRKKMDTTKRNVLIGHAFVIGGEESESERPLSVGGSGYVDVSNFKGFDYVALGHLHRPQKAGGDNIRYSGSLMKYSFSEVNHKKVVYLIDMDRNGDIDIKNISLKPKKDLKCIEGYLNDLLNRVPDDLENTEDYLLVKLKDEGAILDPAGKLRRIYPNVLRIEREQFSSDTSKDIKAPGKDYNKLSDIELFKSFYTQVSGKDFSDEKIDAFNEMLKEFYEKEADK